MSVLNQKMDEQMPYFKRVPGGGLGQGVSHTRCIVATAETETEMETGAAQGVPQVQWYLPGEGVLWSGLGRGRAWLALHSSIKMRSVVCPKHKHTKLAPVEPRLFIINTKKTPRTNCSRCWACLQPPAGPLSVSLSPSLCAEWLIIRRHRRRRRRWSRLRHCRNSSVCGSNTCRALPCRAVPGQK